MAEGLKQAVEEILRLAFLVAIQALHELDEGRDEFFGLGSGHAPSVLPSEAESVNAFGSRR